MTEGGARVLVVDDSPFARKTLREALERNPNVASVNGAANGRVALEMALRHPPDLVTLDLHMPVMDGFTFLRMFRARSKAPVLVVSSHGDLANVETCLGLGATGFVTKPTDPYGKLKTIEEELHLKVGQVLRSSCVAPVRAPASIAPCPEPGLRTVGFPVFVLGSSSGGPPSLQYILSGFSPPMGAAVLIAQHMPEGFTRPFARRLDQLLPIDVREAADGDEVRPGSVLVAPGGRNLAVRMRGTGARVVLERPSGEHFVPSVDRLLETAAEAFGARLTAVILTGMGKDGAAGVRSVAAAGGRVLAESRETATIFGMPREAAATGCVEAVLPLPEIAVELMKRAGQVNQSGEGTPGVEGQPCKGGVPGLDEHTESRPHPRVGQQDRSEVLPGRQ